MTVKVHWMTKECLWDRCCASLWCKVSPLIGMNVCVCISNTPLQSPHLNCGAHIADSTGSTAGNIPCFQAFAPASSGWIWLVNRDRGSAMPERRGEWGNKCLLRIAQEMQETAPVMSCHLKGVWKQAHTSVIQMLTPGGLCCHGGGGMGLWQAKGPPQGRLGWSVVGKNRKKTKQ